MNINVSINKMKINNEVLEKSLKITNEIFETNKHLRISANAYELYNSRAEGFRDLGITEEGYISFIPKVNNINEIIITEWQKILREEYQHFYNKFLSNVDLDEQFKRKWIYYQLYSLDINHIIERKIPDFILKRIKELKDEGFKNNIEILKKLPTSPKLTKLLVYLFGEKKGGIVDWITNKCPNNLESSEMNEYRIYISVLPHHIAGMSYYSSANFGGEEWNGYNGTSCQDPRRSERHDLINHLPASLAENTLAVAWLAKKENSDIWNPVYEARALIRIVPCPRKNIFIICRPYYNSNDSKYILIEGLKNQFKNRIIYSGDYLSGEKIYINVEIDDVSYQGYKMEECWKCNGDGVIWVESEIDCDCGGDDENCLVCNGAGYYYDEVEEQCPECDGTGEIEEMDAIYLPYIDDTHIIDMYDTCIVYDLPIDLLISMGAIMEEDLIEEENY